MSLASNSTLFNQQVHLNIAFEVLKPLVNGIQVFHRQIHRGIDCSGQNVLLCHPFKRKFLSFPQECFSFDRFY